MGDEDTYANIKTLFGRRTNFQQETLDLQINLEKLKTRKKKERLRANEAARVLRQTHKLPPLDHMFEKNHEVKFKQYKLNSLSCHIVGGTHVEPAPSVPSVRVPTMSIQYQAYEPKKKVVVEVDVDADFANTFLSNTTMDQVRARIDKSTLNIPTKAKPRLPFLQAIERF